MRPLWVWMILLMLGGPAYAQGGLYAALNRTQGYAVGGALEASGLHRLAADTAWHHLGWNHPRVNGIAYDPTDPRVLYLAAGNGVLRTLDGGGTWRLVTGWQITEAQALAVDPHAPARLYLATASGVWRSADRGDSWHAADSGLAAPVYATALAVDRAEAGRVIVGTWHGLYGSDDGARSWRPLGPPGVPIQDLRQSRPAPAVWLAATHERGVLRSDDGGRTWHAASGRLARQTIQAVALDPHDARRMAAAGWDTGVFLSTDGGRSWKQRRRGLPTPHLTAVLFDAHRPGRLWAATLERGLFFTDDGGRSWHRAGLSGALVFDLIFLPPATP